MAVGWWQQPATWKALSWRRRWELLFQEARPNLEEVEAALDYCDWWQARGRVISFVSMILGAVIGAGLAGFALGDAGVAVATVLGFTFGAGVNQGVIMPRRIRALRDNVESTAREGDRQPVRQHRES